MNENCNENRLQKAMTVKVHVQYTKIYEQYEQHIFLNACMK